MSETPIQLTKDALKDYEHLDASLRKDIENDLPFEQRNFNYRKNYQYKDSDNLYTVSQF